MTRTHRWLTALFRRGPVTGAATSQNSEPSLEPDLPARCPADGNRSRGELLEAVWVAASAGLWDCPGWLIAAIEDCERTESSERRT